MGATREQFVDDEEKHSFGIHDSYEFRNMGIRRPTPFPHPLVEWHHMTLTNYSLWGRTGVHYDCM